MNVKITLINDHIIECVATEIGKYSDLTSIKIMVDWATRELIKASRPKKLEIKNDQGAFVEKAFREFYIEGCIFDLDKQDL